MHDARTDEIAVGACGTLALVLNEQRATALHYDGVTDVVRVFVRAPPGTVRTVMVPATLLLDRAGFLVGVDVDPDGRERVIVMLGPHEAVDRTAPSRVSVSTDASGSIYEVRVQHAQKTVRAKDKSPYLP